MEGLKSFWLKKLKATDAPEWVKSLSRRPNISRKSNVCTISVNPSFVCNKFLIQVRSSKNCMFSLKKKLKNYECDRFSAATKSKTPSKIILRMFS